jgi:hypothetical protein
MAQIYQIQRPTSTAQATSMYYARRRQKARRETTAGRHGGMREQVFKYGVKMAVRLTVV